MGFEQRGLREMLAEQRDVGFEHPAAVLAVRRRLAVTDSLANQGRREPLPTVATDDTLARAVEFDDVFRTLPSCRDRRCSA